MRVAAHVAYRTPNTYEEEVNPGIRIMGGTVDAAQFPPGNFFLRSLTPSQNILNKSWG